MIIDELCSSGVGFDVSDIGIMNLSAGDFIPVAELDENMVAMYVQDVKEKLEEVFVPFKKLCRTREV